jgi:hypothetical protein
MGKLKSSLCRNVSFITVPACPFRAVGQGMKHIYLYLWYTLCEAQWDRCDQRNHQAQNYFGEMTSSI